MAEEPIEQQPAAGGEEKAVAQEKGGKSFLFLVLPALVLALAGGGWLAFSYYPSLVQAAQYFGRDFGDEADDEETAPVEYGQFTELQGLIINPSDSEGRRYLMLNLGLEATEESTLAELEQKDIVVRDTILRLLSQRSVSELADISQREQIKTELLAAINEVIAEGEIVRLYFTQYVLQ